MLTQDDLKFDEACRKLVDSPEKTIIIDLSGVRTITSTYIGILAVTYVDARNSGKEFIIRAPSKVLDVFRIAGFGDGNAILEEVPYTPIQ